MFLVIMIITMTTLLVSIEMLLVKVHTRGADSVLLQTHTWTAHQDDFTLLRHHGDKDDDNV